MVDVTADSRSARCQLIQRCETPVRVWPQSGRSGFWGSVDSFSATAGGGRCIRAVELILCDECCLSANNQWLSTASSSPSVLLLMGSVAARESRFSAGSLIFLGTPGALRSGSSGGTETCGFGFEYLLSISLNVKDGSGLWPRMIFSMSPPLGAVVKFS